MAADGNDVAFSQSVHLHFTIGGLIVDIRSGLRKTAPPPNRKMLPHLVSAIVQNEGPGLLKWINGLEGRNASPLSVTPWGFALTDPALN
jgi:hypothetical protein